MYEFVVLGTSAALPSPHSLPNCWALKYGSVYLFECCEAAQQQMMKFGVSYAKVRVIFLSHTHADAFLGIFGLTQTLNLIGRKETLTIVVPKGSKAFLAKLFAMHEFRTRYTIEIKEAKSGVVWKEQSFTVKAFATKHNAPSLGYAVIENDKLRFDEKKAKSLGLRGQLFTQIQEKKKVKLDGKIIKIEDVTYKQKGRTLLVFAGDTRPCPNTIKMSKEAELLVHDSSFGNNEAAMAKDKMHSTAKEAAEVALKAKVKKLVLTHFSNRYHSREPLLEEAKEVFANSCIAHEGESFKIN